MIKWFPFFLWFIFIMTPFSSAQTGEGTVYGIIQQEQVPLFPATVRMETQETTTDSSGNFTMKSTTDSTFIASCPGYQPDTVSLKQSSSRIVFQLTPQKEVETNTTRFEVFGMGCPNCHAGVEKHLESIPVVKSARANWQKKEVEIELYPCTTITYRQFKNAMKKPT